MRFFLRSPLFEEPAKGGPGDGTPPAITKEDVDKAVNGAVTRIEKENKALKTQLETLTASLTAVTEKLTTIETKPPEVKDPPKPGDLPPEANATIINLQKTVKALTDRVTASDAKATAAEEKQAQLAKESKVRQALSGFKFRNPQSADVAFRIILGDVAPDEEGNLIGANLPLDAYVKKTLDESLDGLLLPDPAKGGAGAKGGGPRSSGGFDIDTIKPGMSKDDLAKARAAIADKWKS